MKLRVICYKRMDNLVENINDLFLWLQLRLDSIL